MPILPGVRSGEEPTGLVSGPESGRPGILRLAVRVAMLGRGAIGPGRLTRMLTRE